MIDEVLRHFGDSMLLQIARRGTNHKARARELASNQSWINFCADAYRNIKTFFNQVDHPIVECDIDLNSRISLQVFCDRRAQMAGTKRIRGTHPQNSTRNRSFLRYRTLGLRDHGQDLDRTLVIVMAGLRE